MSILLYGKFPDDMQTDETVRGMAMGRRGMPSLREHAVLSCNSVDITQVHRKKAETIFPFLVRILTDETLSPDPLSLGRVVIGVYGGSGSGKSGTAIALADKMRHSGISTYVIAGDNYPRRVPKFNDAERLRIYRLGGLNGLIENQLYDTARSQEIMALQEQGLDCQSNDKHPWLEQYISSGKESLAAYLGSPDEIDFDEVNDLIRKFKYGASVFHPKHMGRDLASIWYDSVPLHNIQALIIEWTHANSPYLHGIDIPVYLMSTPKQTLGHRLARNRDDAIDSPFTSLVLDIEQHQLIQQMHKAKIIISYEGQRVDKYGNPDDTDSIRRQMD